LSRSFSPDFVSLYGHDDFDASMGALKFFTPFGSSEFAIREFLKRDLSRTLRVMQGWSEDPNEHVRRLASEGSRPRLPWSFRLSELVADPSPRPAHPRKPQG
jgi:3-methyladenine DNA glycosylase AlkC